MAQNMNNTSFGMKKDDPANRPVSNSTDDNNPLANSNKGINSLGNSQRLSKTKRGKPPAMPESN